jgi:hypothetical protein
MEDFSLFSVCVVERKHCSTCRIETAHHPTASGEYVCWCETVFIDESEIEKDIEWLKGIETWNN